MNFPGWPFAAVFGPLQALLGTVAGWNVFVLLTYVGAGGLANALPEILHGSGRGGRVQLRAVPSDEPGMAAPVSRSPLSRNISSVPLPICPQPPAMAARIAGGSCAWTMLRRPCSRASPESPFSRLRSLPSGAGPFDCYACGKPAADKGGAWPDDATVEHIVERREGARCRFREAHGFQ